MKKYLLALICALSLSMLCGCSLFAAYQTATDTDTDVSAMDEVPVETDTGTDTDTDTDTGSSINGATYQRGAWNDNVYQNEWLGVSITCPEGWDIWDDEALAGESDSYTTYEMEIEDPESLDGVWITLQDVNELGDTTLTAESYADLLKNEAENSSSYTAETLSEGTRTIGGNTYEEYSMRLTAQGETADQIFLVRRVDDYIVCVVAMAFDGHDIEDVIGLCA